MSPAAQPHCWFATTAPKAGASIEQIAQHAKALNSQLSNIDHTGVIIYDIQDESQRTQTPRPFPFAPNIDSGHYSALLSRCYQQRCITYKSVAGLSPARLALWLEEISSAGISDLVLVGAPSGNNAGLSLQAAYQELRASPLTLGGVTIAERHLRHGNEGERLVEKLRSGCQFFVSQAVYDSQANIQLLEDYARQCQRHKLEIAPLVLTFSPCGSLKTLEFIDWLGIKVDSTSRQRLLQSSDLLAESLLICQQNFQRLHQRAQQLGVPLGINVESLTHRASECQRALELFSSLAGTLRAKSSAHSAIEHQQQQTAGDGQKQQAPAHSAAELANRFLTAHQPPANTTL